ncbi:membrane-bound lytic murein transglycosylase MltC [Candidatus Erwinia haradaeae]|uniref:peptidoglycan lytic exotransglycosylase n=1 Tax=Candidatus Erwinia haradaeae TaxID=1922217 RepID=A0A451D9A0_9GAMM|nr:membrane-bound lytic murein transglycosylase MltC [Candidatus Erwinia haradaeae]VFP82878.1 Membrane-bound lytic murein transglycosylase C [Candidatus Erwinia haradaeae]
MNNNLIFLFLVGPLLASCSHKINDTFCEELVKDTNAFDILMEQFAYNIDNLWGDKEVLIAGPQDYIQYSDQYHTRSHINFSAGRVTVSTIDNNNPVTSLRKAIVNILVIGDDPSDLHSNSDRKKIALYPEPLLYGQVVNNTGQLIIHRADAVRYADYLLQHRRNYRHSGSHVIWSVTIPMVSNHLDQRARKYLSIVKKASERYGISQSLILAIMEIESSFNPYAVSHSNALGLMQIVQNTAGLDVFRMQGKHGQPSRRYLLDPEKNIDVGVAYLSLLQRNYFADIRNPVSRIYAVITAYHAGAGSVFRVFSSKKDRAVSVINRLSSEEVYKMLMDTHPRPESRRYLYKVRHAQKAFNRY